MLGLKFSTNLEWMDIVNKNINEILIIKNFGKKHHIHG